MTNNEKNETPNTVTLENPIVRGETEITEISLRKPSAGELRGVSLLQLMQVDVGTLITVLPRITTPALTVRELQDMDPVDFMALAGEVSVFFLGKADRDLYRTA